MASIQVTTVGLNVQVLGRWNPAILVPRWFSDVELVPSEETQAANLTIVHPEISQFETDWFGLTATKDRLIVTTTRVSHAEALRDLVAGTLDLLSHTPLTAIGINHDYTLEFPARKPFDEFGWMLVPPEHWALLNRPGMATLQVQGERTDGEPGYVRVKVEPVLDGGFRVVVGVNNHFVLTETGPGAAATASRILRERWYSCEQEAEAIKQDLAERPLSGVR